MNRRGFFGSLFGLGLIPFVKKPEEPIKYFYPIRTIQFSGKDFPQEEIDRIHVEWEQYQGPENAGKLIVGAPGGKLR